MGFNPCFVTAVTRVTRSFVTALRFQWAAIFKQIAQNFPKNMLKLWQSPVSTAPMSRKHMIFNLDVLPHVLYNEDKHPQKCGNRLNNAVSIQLEQVLSHVSHVISVTNPVFECLAYIYYHFIGAVTYCHTYHT